MARAWNGESSRAPTRTNVAGVALDGQRGLRHRAALEGHPAVAHQDLEDLLADPELVDLVHLRDGVVDDHRLHGEEAPLGAGRPVGIRLVEELQAPAREREDRLPQLLPGLGEPVEPGTPVLRNGRLLHQTVVAEHPQPIGEQVGADPGEVLQQALEAGGADQQLPHDEEGPPLADDVQSGGQTAELSVFSFHDGLLHSRCR